VRSGALRVRASRGTLPRVLTTLEEAPTLSLVRFVDQVKLLAPNEGRVRHEFLPDGRTSLVFRVLDNGRRGDVSVAGPCTRMRIKEPRGVVRALIVEFKPGWSTSLLGVAAHELTDRIVPLDEIWGCAGADLYARLVEARDVPEQIECVSRAIARRLQRSTESSSAGLARRAVRLLQGGEVRVDRVAARLGITARHLRRAFTENVGVGPKEYARSVRLRRALRLAATSRDWGRIALDAGYYDQAHLIADFRQLVRVTPGAFVRHARAADVRCV